MQFLQNVNEQNFHFTQIPDKNNDVIFLKSPKTLFLSYFWSFLVILLDGVFFPKNLAVTNSYIWAPITMLSLKKTNEPILRKYTDRRKDGRKDRQTLFYRTLPAEAGGPIKKRKK